MIASIVGPKRESASAIHAIGVSLNEPGVSGAAANAVSRKASASSTLPCVDNCSASAICKDQSDASP